MEMAKPSGSNQYKDTYHNDRDPPTLEALGLSYVQSSRYQNLASVPEADLQHYFASTKQDGGATLREAQVCHPMARVKPIEDSLLKPRE